MQARGKKHLQASSHQHPRGPLEKQRPRKQKKLRWRGAYEQAAWPIVSLILKRKLTLKLRQGSSVISPIGRGDRLT